MNKKVKIPSFKIASLGSGSKGNATLISTETTSLMIDCGFTVKETISRCNKLDFSLENLDAILVTHEHQDHIKGAGALSRRFNLPIYSTQGTFLSQKLGKVEQFTRIKSQQKFSIGDIEIAPFSVPHDAREPCQFAFNIKGKNMAVLSDLGSITPSIVETLKRCEILLLEMNHDHTMLMEGPYHYQLKQRVAGKLGHLNNEQSIKLLQQLDLSKVELLVATHLSEQNNCPKLVESLLTDVMKESASKIVIACQNDGVNWIEIT